MSALAGRVFTTTEAAVYVGRSRQRMAHYRAAGLIHGRLHGHVRLFEQDELDRLRALIGDRMPYGTLTRREEHHDAC